jgi:asparagine synthase (glutamine-hydrolysing)
MCGIFGHFSDPSGQSLESLDRCRDTMTHRGPEMAGSFCDRGLYLGFRRLRILDLSSEGNQPMTTVDGRYTVVFNGEIYNYLELRAELENAGEVFRGHSDTEVLLHLYAKHGTDCFEKLNGMFAFGVYDKRDRTLLLVRDRLGVKPLFYWQNGTSLSFASELRALRWLRDFPTAIDPTALGLYFRLGAVPEWTSIYRGVSKLPPGSWIRCRLDAGIIDTPVLYWDLPPVGEDGNKTEDEWIDEIEALLWDATRLRLRSDVPLALFLSGGIDSGLIAAAAARQVKGLASLTIGFADEPEDESALALTTAAHLGLNAVHRSVELKEGLEALPRVMAHFDEPFSDTSALPTSIICAEARKEFTVILSGDGGDEVFGGYNSHVRAWHWRYVERLPPSWRRAIGLLIASVSPPDSMRREFSRRFQQPVGRFGLGGHQYPFQDWPARYLKPEFNVSPDTIANSYNYHLPAWPGATTIDLAQRSDLRVYMLEDILVKVDRMSMAHSVEVRSPFLDYRLVELGLKIPSRLRVKNGVNKYLLRRLAARHLPESVVRAPKRGFGIPRSSWMRDDAGGFASAILPMNQQQPYPFVAGGAERLWQNARENSDGISALIAVLCYRWWCQGASMAGYTLRDTRPLTESEDRVAC